MRTVSPDPPRLGVVDGLAYAVFAPSEGDVLGGVVVCHGANSAKESHYDFARLLRSTGIAAVCFDARGHGESAGPLGPGLVDDVAAVASVLDLPEGAPVGLRGSSMGGWLALAAAERLRAAAVVAICPAPSEGLSRGIAGGRITFDAAPGLAEAIAAVDLPAAARRLGERLLLLHADGDEIVPVEVSRALHAAAPGSRIVVTPGGHHRSIQHDAELQAFSARWLATAFGR